MCIVVKSVIKKLKHFFKMLLSIISLTTLKCLLLESTFDSQKKVLHEQTTFKKDYNINLANLRRNERF